MFVNCKAQHSKDGHFCPISCTLNAIPIKILPRYFVEYRQHYFKVHVERWNCQKKNFKRENKVGLFYLLD